MGYELIITEKPSAAKKIATALSEGKLLTKKLHNVSYYELTHKGNQIVVACAVGHLYNLVEKSKSGWSDYPVFDIMWKPTYEINKNAEYTKNYLKTIISLGKKANKFTVATDYDVEGEVIGLNCVKFGCSQKDARRMKFSTLTKPDLIKAYDAVEPTLNWGQANAGVTRHFLDWLYGINLSKALTTSIKRATGNFKLLSTGRVQGPALKIVVDKEREIQAFEPVKYWQIDLNFLNGENELVAPHIKDKFWEKPEADSALENAKKADEAIVDGIKQTKSTKKAPNPIDLTTLQTESYRVFKISPKETLSLAQELYTSGLISYPRTSSQELPKEIGYEKIMGDLVRNSKYTGLVNSLLSTCKPLKPNNGKKKDPAHPAIYPTGIHPENLKPREQKLYDLIVKRFLATFAKEATRATMKVTLKANDESFICKGTKTTIPGWHEFYAPYVKLEEVELPSMEKGDKFKIKSIDQSEKETQPPKRYHEASIIKELEKRGLGTKATRAAIVDTLFQRGYVQGKALEATILGQQTSDVLTKYVPDISSEDLTKNFEEQMDKIREDAITGEAVLDDAKSLLTTILEKIHKQEGDIGKALSQANISSEKIKNTLGSCPNCENGFLVIKKSRFGRFVACDAYPDCKTTLKIPQKGNIKAAKKQCELCNYPMVKATVNKRIQEICLNQNCKSKITNQEITEDTKENIPNLDSTCPKCKKGTLSLRKSIYGKFLGCSDYPTCKYVEQILVKKKEEDNSETKKEEEK